MLRTVVTLLVSAVLVSTQGAVADERHLPLFNEDPFFAGGPEYPVLELGTIRLKDGECIVPNTIATDLAPPTYTETLPDGTTEVFNMMLVVDGEVQVWVKISAIQQLALMTCFENPYRWVV